MVNANIDFGVSSAWAKWYDGEPEREWSRQPDDQNSPIVSVTQRWFEDREVVIQGMVSRESVEGQRWEVKEALRRSWLAYVASLACTHVDDPEMFIADDSGLNLIIEVRGEVVPLWE